MRSDQQLDLINHSPKRLAQAHRIAADTALHNPYWTPQEQRDRHAYEITQAERLERQEQAA